MSQGTLYGDVQTRSILPVGLVKAFKLDITLSSRDNDAFKAAFPSGKVPAFVGPKGYKLQEAIAVLYYCMYLISFFFYPSIYFYYNDEKNYSFKTVIPVLRDHVENSNLKCFNNNLRLIVYYVLCFS